MAAYLEVWGPSGPEAFPLVTDRLAIGKSRANDLVLSGDPKVSRTHAVLERVAATWTIRDVGSRNGTFVNGERIATERAVRPGDEIRLGSTRVVLRGESGRATTATTAAAPPPELTRRERDVLIELCRPLLSGDVFTEPASVKQIAQQLYLTEPTVKQHLTNLYLKFGILEGQERRRPRLANDAIMRGAVTIADLRA